MKTNVKEYVVSFIFSSATLTKVWLIEKQKPDWQKDCFNGIGGKLEKNETPKRAAQREIQEEGGVFIPDDALHYVGFMHGINNDNSNFRVHIFTGITYINMETMETEIVKLIPVSAITNFPHIENVPLLVETCKYYISGKSNFSRIILEYQGK